MVRLIPFSFGPYDKNKSRLVHIFDSESGEPSGTDGFDIIDQNGKKIGEKLPIEVQYMKEAKDYDDSEVVAYPKDSVMDGVVTNKFISTWRERITESAKTPEIAMARLAKFENPDAEILIIQYETTDKKYVGEQAVNYFEFPSEKSQLGRIIKKYHGLKVGTQIKIDFDGEGYTSIKVDK